MREQIIFIFFKYKNISDYSFVFKKETFPNHLAKHHDIENVYTYDHHNKRAKMS